MSFIRLHKDAAATWLSRLLPAAIFILVGLFSIMVIRDYGRESAAAGRRCWKRKCTHSRSGVRHASRYGNADASRAAADIAGRDGGSAGRVVVRRNGCAGVIITHSNHGMVGKSLYSASEMHQLNPGPQERWRRVDVAANGETVPALEIYRQFQPLFGMRGHGMRARHGA